MSGFKCSDDELEMNKVLKMNQDVSQSMLDDQQMSQTRSDPLTGANKMVIKHNNQCFDYEQPQKSGYW